MALAGNLAVKKEALLSVGGFNINIKFYGDDTDLAKRLSKLGRIKFTKKFYIRTSARRIIDHGLLKTGLIYTLNFLWIVLFNRPFSKSSTDVRV